MQPATILQAFESYGIRPDSVDLPQGGYRNKVYTARYKDNQFANLIVYKDEPGILTKIRQADRLSNFLHNQGLLVRHNLDTRILTLNSKNTTLYAGLYNYLPGSTIAWEAYTMNHLKALGLAMANIHTAAARLSRNDEALLSEVCKKQIAVMQDYFANTGVISAMSKKLKLRLPTPVLSKLTELTKVSANDSQLLHMDFVRGNILFQTSVDLQTVWNVGNVRVSGVIDFEKIAYGNVLFDLARTLAFLLVDCKHKTGSQVYKYFLGSGYIKRGQGKRPNRVELKKLINYFLIYDFYKFLKHSPFESLTANHHFRRTVAILLSENLLEKT